MKVDAETEWTPVTERRRFRIKTGSCSCRGDEEAEEHSADDGHC